MSRTTANRWSRRSCAMVGAGMLIGIVAAVTVAAQPGTTTGADPGRYGQCSICHPEQRVAFEGSVHGGGEITCDACHGGDPTSRDVDRAHKKPFDTHESRRGIPALCAKCHADFERMRHYNLPTDQLALYQTSAHGRRLAEGDENVAVCTDCHGSHDMLPASDPRSPVHRRNLPATCGGCHDDRELMEPYGGTTRPYANYMQSIHAKELYEHANPKAPVCSDCHGVHGAAPPEYGDIHRVCGQCHNLTREYFERGPHGAGLGAAGLPECSSCHDHHAVDTSPGERFSDMCLTCHEGGSRGAVMGEQIDVLLTTAAADINQADSLVARAERVPLAVDDYKARLQEARTYLTEVRPISHEVAVEPIETMTRRARSLAGEVESEVRGKLRDLSLRRFGLLAFWFYVVLTVAILADYRRRRTG